MGKEKLGHILGDLLHEAMDSNPSQLECETRQWMHSADGEQN